MSAEVRPPDVETIENATIDVAGRELFDALPVALVSVDGRGKLVATNAAARERLQLRVEETVDGAVTRVGATRKDGRGQFLLTIGRVPRIRFAARESSWRECAATSLRVLTIDDAESPDANEPARLRARISLQLDAVDRAADLLGSGSDATDGGTRAQPVDVLKRRLRDLRLMVEAPASTGPRDPTRLPAIPVRELFAEIVRRARRHYAGLAGRPFTVEDRLRGDDRAARAHPVSLTQAVLTLVHLFTLEPVSARVTVGASLLGCRFAISVVAPPDHSGKLPELRRRRPLLAALSPIIAAHGATLELVRDPSGRSVARLTLPTVPPPT